jgi:ubiquitin carboxyl-terminal hydrolase 4/11
MLIYNSVLLVIDLCAFNTHTSSTGNAKKSSYNNDYSSAYSGYTSYSGYNDSYSSYSRLNNNQDTLEDNHVAGHPVISGAVGLRNLGNTCFMNSILQCLSNTSPLTEIFLTNRYKQQLNLDNPLGHGGKLAQVYAKLLKAIWSDAYSIVVPRAFKRTIGEFQPQFAGYEQHDSQELMGFLIDGLHEDLNRIRKKPFVEAIESNGREDEFMSRESWRRYLLRNDSELVDILYGQTRSHVTCTNCKRESVTFEAFNCLSLPIPIKNTKTLLVMVQLLPLGSDLLKLPVEITYGITIKELKALVVEKLRHHGLISANMTNDGSLSEKTTKLSVEDMSISTHSPDSDSDYVNITHQSLDEDQPAAVEATSPLPELHFHVCTFWSQSYNRIVNTLADSAQVHKSIHSSETYYFIQLEHDVPSKYPYSSSSYGLSSSTSLTTTQLSYVDLLVGEMKTVYNYASAQTMGMPLRFSYATNSTTFHDVHELVWSMIKRRYIPDSSPLYRTGDQGADHRPYDLVYSSATVLDKRGPLSASMTTMFSVGWNECLLVLWKQGYRSNPNDFIDKSNHFITVDADNILVEGTDNDNGDLDDDSDSYPSKKKNKPSAINLYQCLDAFSIRETLPSTETYYCAHCKQHLAPLKKMDIWSCPDVLVIHLKRFQYTQGTYHVHRDKITETIDFPIDGLDLRAFVKGPIDESAPPVYDLYAVSHHSGSLYGGHYTAVCRNPKNNKWYNYNDSSVSETTPESAVSGQAYVLFYKRRTGSLKWGGIVPFDRPPEEEEAKK